MGALAARELGVGFVGARKEINASADSDSWVRVSTPPDYRARQLDFGFRRGQIRAGERVLIVDDWAETGSQLLALHRIVAQCEAEVVGTGVIVDALQDPRVRRDLRLKALLRGHKLW